LYGIVGLYCSVLSQIFFDFVWYCTSVLFSFVFRIVRFPPACPGAAALAAPVRALMLGIACVALSWMQWPAPFQLPRVAAPNHQGGLYFSETSQHRRCLLGTAAAARRRPAAAAPRRNSRGGGGGQGGGGRAAFAAHDLGWLRQRVDELVGVDDLEGSYKVSDFFYNLSSGAPASFLAWRVPLIPGIELDVELRPPPGSRRPQIRYLRIVEDLMKKTGSILESSDVYYPMEVCDEFLADEMPLRCASNLFLKDVLERAAGTGNQPAHFGQLAEDNVVQSCKELVVVWRIVARREVRRGPHIIPAGAQPPILDALCAQRQARNISWESTTVKIIGTHQAP
jgi:hypothetical protein